MAMGLYERIEERLQALGLKARDASMQATDGVDPDLIRNIKRNRSSSLKGARLIKLAKLLETSPEWLENGTGSITAAAPSDNSSRSRVPLISWVSAGKMAFPDITDEIIGYVIEGELDPDGDWIALRVVGDSMDRISPPESIIFVNRNDKVLVPNACYVISNGDGEATYKRFRPNPMRFEPVSTNPAHEPIFPSREPLIVGRVRRSVLPM